MTMMLAVLMLASCSKEQGARLIPDDAFVVIRLNVMKTMESTGMKGDDTSMKTQIEKLIKSAGLEKEVREKLMELIDDPTSSGIDFTEPVYLYLSGGGRDGFEGGVTGTTASKGDLADIVKMLGDMNDDITLEDYKSDGVQYARIDRGTVLIFNSDWFFIGPIDRSEDWEDAAESTIEDLLERASGNNNIGEHPAFQQMCERKGLMQVGIFGSGIENMPIPSEVTSSLPDDCELKDVAGIMDLAINNGEIVMECEGMPMSEAWEKQWNLLDYKEIEKSQAKYADADGALAIVNIDPKGIFDYVKAFARNAGVRTRDLERLDELKPIFNAFTGKGMVAVNNWDENDGPEIVAYVGTKNTKLLDQLVGEGSDDVMSVGNNEYRIPIDYDYDYNDSIGDWVMTATKFMQAGWKNDQTYFLMNTDDEPFTTPRKAFTDVKGIGAYARTSGRLLGDAVSTIDYDMDQAGQFCADIVDYIELYMESPTKYVFRIATKKKDKSPIVAIIDYVKKHHM